MYFVFLLLSKNTNLQWAWNPLPTLMKEQQTVLALNCAKRESTAEASGSANTPSVITTAPDQTQNKADRNLCKMVFYSNRAANLWRNKIWRPSLFHYNHPPPPPEIKWTLPLLPIPDKYGNDWGHYVKSYMKYKLSKFVISFWCQK